MFSLFFFIFIFIYFWVLFTGEDTPCITAYLRPTRLVISASESSRDDFVALCEYLFINLSRSICTVGVEGH